MQTASNAALPRYSIIIPAETVACAAYYLEELRGGETEPGAYLRDCLQGADIQGEENQRCSAL